MILTDRWKSLLFEQACGGSDEAQNILKRAGLWSTANEREVVADANSPATMEVLRIHRERQTILYICAVERGELETVNAILEEAENDADLWNLLDAANAEMLTDEDRAAAADLLESLKDKEN